ncbi:hypothetical protein NX081_17320 [Bacillus velezensis]|uniref:hypothetical protein n=1 Tax=Bacillus amyloliquefaciens group TaxID=1938374 RepID=UPI001F108C98|nr:MULTISPECIES: hypothetical protein [Bacillus amyloliquefaciens group]MEE3674321.1 hypothetical protein [Bacillus velezensis]UWD96797.1 hypothetical protein NX081_17320 [Bacillus velezensis]WVH69127.1 hypothetical protein VT264_15475 [Bacillus velezensis]
MAFELNLSRMSIYELLEMAVESNEIIYTRSNQRRLGKTKALMSYAEINQLPVIIPQRQKGYYQKKHPNVNLYGHEEVLQLDGLPLTLLCDEGVPKRTIEEMKTRCYGVSGFLNESLEDSVMNAINCEKSILAFREIEPPLLQIKLDDLNSVPRVLYKGEEIKNKVRVDFSYLTGDEYGIKPIYIDIVTLREDASVREISHNQGAISINEKRLR